MNQNTLQTSYQKYLLKKNTKKTNKKDTNDCWFIFLIKEQNVKKKIGLAKKQPSF